MSHSVILTGYFIPVSHVVNKNSSQVPPTTSLFLLDFHQVCSYFTRNILSTIFLLWSDYLQKILVFQSKTNFSFNSFLFGFGFTVSLFYDAFLHFYHHETTFSWLPTWPLVNLWDIAKEFIVWRLQAVVVFSVFKETKFEVDTALYLSYYLYFKVVISFWRCKEWII